MSATLEISRRSFLRTSAVTATGLVAGFHHHLAKAIPAGPVGGKPMTGNIVVGLDIGSSKVCAAVAERLPDGMLQLLGIGEAPSHASKWGIVDIEGTRRSVREALVNAEINTDVMIGSVVLGLKAGPQGRLRDGWAVCDFNHDHEDDWPFVEAFMETPEPWNDVRRIVDFARDQEEALLLDLHGERLLAHAPYPAFWNDDPIVQVTQAVIASAAAAEAVLSQADKDRGALVIDLGAATTQFTVFTDGLVHSDCIQVGGRYLAIDVPPELVFRLDRLERRYAGDNCVEAGKSCGTGRGGAVRKKTRDRSIENFDSMRWMQTFELVKARLELNGIRLDSLRGGVHLTGGYSVLPDMPLFAKWMLGIPAQIGRATGIAGPASLLKNARYSCAFGLTKLAV